MFKNIIKWFAPRRSRKNCHTSYNRAFGNSRRLRHEILEDRRMLATLTVNVNDDFASNNDNGFLTLREAIAVVNRLYVPNPNINGDILQIETFDDTEPIGINDKIIFSTDPDDGLSVPGGATILLDLGDASTVGQELSITESVIIDASMLPNGLTVKAHDLTPLLDNGDGTGVFDIDILNHPNQNGLVTLAGLTITGGASDTHYTLAV